MRTYRVRVSIEVQAETPASAIRRVVDILSGDASPCGLESPVVGYRVTSASPSDHKE